MSNLSSLGTLLDHFFDVTLEVFRFHSGGWEMFLAYQRLWFYVACLSQDLIELVHLTFAFVDGERDSFFMILVAPLIATARARADHSHPENRKNQKKMLHS